MSNILIFGHRAVLYARCGCMHGGGVNQMGTKADKEGRCCKTGFCRSPLWKTSIIKSNNC